MNTSTTVFDIRNHLERLNIIKETSTEYHCSCPVCNEGGFKIEKKSGKYNAFGNKNILRWSQSDIACWLAERYRPSLAWNTEEKEWYKYSAETDGIWGCEPEEFIGQLVKSELEVLASKIATAQGEKKRPTYTYSFIKGVVSMMKLDLAVKRWDEAEGLLPLLNGVLDLSTRKLIPHAPQHRLTWCLPYSYTVLATCDPIKEWLLEMCGGDECDSFSTKTLKSAWY